MKAAMDPGGEWLLTSQLIELGYRCAAEPDLWPEFIQQLVARSDSRSGRLLVLNREADQVVDSVKYNIDGDYHRSYVDYYVNICPWRPELRAKPSGRFYSTYHDFSCPQRDFYHTEFFNDWAGPQDVHHGILGTIAQTESQTVQLLLQRTRTQGPYSPDETDQFNNLIPHLRRILDLGRSFTRQRLIDSAALQASQTSATPFLLLDEDGRVCYLPDDARALLQAVPGLRIAQDGLDVPGGSGRELKRLIQSCLPGDRNGWQHSGGSLRLTGFPMAPLFISVLPIHPDHPLLPLERHAFVALFLSSPAWRPGMCWRSLRELYGFTPAECSLVTQLVAGACLQTAAKEGGVSLNTVRSQLKSIFRKTGVNRQPELITLLVSGPAMRRRASPPLKVSS